jgi:hypothetical protein
MVIAAGMPRGAAGIQRATPSGCAYPAAAAGVVLLLHIGGTSPGRVLQAIPAGGPRILWFIPSVQHDGPFLGFVFLLASLCWALGCKPWAPLS